MTVPAITKAQIADTLSKIRAFSDPTQLSGLNKKNPVSGFGELMKVARQSLEKVNSTQTNADAMKDAYLKGDTNVSLPKVLISSIQSKIAFEGLLVVRNKFIDAYKEIMNMPL